MTPAETLAQFQNAVEKYYRPMHSRVYSSCEYRSSKVATLNEALAAIHKEAVVKARAELSLEL